MVKLVCIDLDGTLLNDKKQISDQDKQVISLARQAAHITIFTGRSYFSAEAISLLCHILKNWV